MIEKSLLPREYQSFPNHWKVLRFTDAFKDKTGGQTKIKKKDCLNHGVLPVIDQGQEFYGGFVNDLGSTCEIDLPCVVFGDHTKVFKYVQDPFALGADGVKVLQGRGDINPKFAYYYLTTLKLPSVGYSRHFKFLKRAFFPLPPIEEQRRIAAILDQADAIRRKRQQAIALTDELLRSTFLEMFGDPVINPKGWEVVPMKKVTRETQYGTSDKANTNSIGLPVLRMNNITYNGEINLNALKWCPIPQTEVAKYTVQEGDLLFNRTNSPELVGKTTVWRKKEKYAYAGYLIRVRFKENYALPEYVSGYLNSSYGKKYLFEKAKPSGNMSNFSASEFVKIPLPLPPLKLQHHFTIIAGKAREYIKTIETSSRQSNNLFNSLLQRAFKGQL